VSSPSDSLIDMDHDAGMTANTTRPLALGYIRAHLLMTETELADAQAGLADFARREGYAFGTVYVERIDRYPAALHALIASVQRDAAATVIVPGVHHLAVHGTPNALKERIEQCTGARVLTARHSP